MYIGLSPGAIGVRVENLSQRIAAAKNHGFAGVEIDVHEVAKLVEEGGAEKIIGQFQEADVIACGWGLPTDWRSSEENWKRDLQELPKLAKAAAEIGCYRVSTWIMPASNDLEFDANLKFHVERFKPIAEIVGEYGHRLGLEFVGPKTLRDKFKHEFVYDLPGMMNMANWIGPNVGLLLDSWHLYTSHGSIAQVEELSETDIVYVHVNDGPLGVPVDEQLDGVRGLPGETGLIDMAGFLGALKRIGYSGPVVPEPFKKELGDLPDDSARLDLVAESMRKIFNLI
ncbi:MAG: sugar phosphate isomerase/epimerase [Fimbriimonas sp.]|nr:sugar phosphate isomerase/epimerase [Fimbriimonas sp.]